MASDDKFRSALSKGGQRRHFTSGQAIYDQVKNPDADMRNGSPYRLVRVTHVDRANEARFLMSGRLKIPDGLRSVGNLYGGSVQVASIGSGNPFAQEAVDGGKHGATGGATIHLVESLQIAKIAQARLAKMPAISHNAHSKNCKIGSHDKIPVRKLIDEICVAGLDVVEVAMRAGWWVERKEQGFPVVPKQQSQKLKAALIEALREIDLAWSKRGIDARGRLGVVGVR